MRMEIKQHSATMVERQTVQLVFRFDALNVNIRFIAERPEGQIWTVRDVYVSHKDYESNEMTLDILKIRLKHLICLDSSNPLECEVATIRARELLPYLNKWLRDNYAIQDVNLE